jgi:DNA-binding NarL/FixJ family response regulator
MTHHEAPDDFPGRFRLLSDRQRDVLELIAQGYSNPAIAARTGLAALWIEEAVQLG